MACGTLVSAVGNGAWFTSWAVFLTRSVGLSPGEVGLGMTVAAFTGVVFTPLFGWLGDRAGARETFGAQLVRDMPYMSLAGMTGTLALCWAMLSSGLPLWVALHTHAPRAISAVVVVVSSLGIAALQTRVSRGITAPARAARAALGSGAALAGACLLLALTAGLGGTPAIAIILAAAALHLTGELLFVASSWGLSVPLMPPDAPSEYQGAFATGESVALMVAPALMTTLVAGWGRPGWIVLAIIFLVPALAIPPVTRWALRTRPV